MLSAEVQDEPPPAPGSHRSPDGHTVFQAVAEVVGLEGVPVGEPHGRPIRPLEVHLQLEVI